MYGVPLGINRDSTDKVVLDSFRKVVRKVHPDKGGSNADVQKLSAARELWENLQKPKAAKSTGGDAASLAWLSSVARFFGEGADRPKADA